MRKVILYIATSVNGYIAREDGNIDWLESIPKLDDSDYGYKDFYESVGTTIMGNATYQQIISWGIDFPYADKKNFVVTSKSKYENTKYVDFISANHFQFIRDLKNQTGDNIWLVGGGYLNTMMLNAGLIDEIIQFIMPVSLPDGIKLFEGTPKETMFDLKSSKIYSNGVTELRYLPKDNI